MRRADPRPHPLAEELKRVRKRLNPVAAAVVVVLACCAVAGAQPAAPGVRKDEAARAALAEHARKTARAFSEQDFETLLDSTHPRVFEAVGGRAPILDALKAAAAEWRAEGAEVVGYEAGEPGEIVRAGARLFAVVPTELKMDTPKAAGTLKSYMLAISDDGGKVWKFVDGAGLNEDVLKVLVPEAVGVVTLPKPEAPVFKDKP